MNNLQKLDKHYRSAYSFEERVPYYEQKKLFAIELEMTAVCQSGCNYCYAGSVTKWNTKNQLTTPELKQIIDDALDMGVQSFSWPGGEPLVYKDWYEVLSYVKQKGGSDKKNFLASTLSLVKTNEMAQKIVEVADDVLFHFDSINKDTFLKVRKFGVKDEWERSLRGLDLLIANGFNPKNIHLAIPIIKPLIKDMKATFDYFFDYIGVGSFSGAVFKPVGRGTDALAFTPSLDEIKYVYELRAEKMNNPDMLLLGPSSTGKLYCETTIGIGAEGQVKGCAVLPDEFTVANIRDNKLSDIWDNYKDSMLCDAPKGHCSGCPSSDICYGCRASAYYFTGSYFNSDPSCWQNPESKEVYGNYLSTISNGITKKVKKELTTK